MTYDQEHFHRIWLYGQVPNKTKKNKKKWKTWSDTGKKQLGTK